MIKIDFEKWLAGARAGIAQRGAGQAVWSQDTWGQRSAPTFTFIPLLIGHPHLTQARAGKKYIYKKK